MKHKNINNFTEEKQMLKTDVVIVGAGPAGIFTALEMIKKGSKKKKPESKPQE